jgi:DNA-binding GntR family transcriptional regulator
MNHIKSPLVLPITPIQVRSKKDAVLEHLKQAIISGALAPGTRLVIDELAAQFGVSQIPVREAITQLQAEGLVLLQPHASAAVAPIQSQLIDEVFALLETCEMVSASALLGKLTPEQDNKLRKILKRLDDAVEDLEEWQAINLELHQALCDMADMPLISATLNRTLDHWNRLRRIYLPDVYAKRLKPAQKAHWDMYRAIRDNNRAALEVAVIQHLRTSRDLYGKELNRVLSMNLTPTK